MNIADGASDIRVIGLESAITAPYTTSALGAMGADVIKVEPPGGEGFREAGTKTETGLSGYFALANCDKRSIELDLKSDRGYEVFMDLVAESDVIVENYRPDVVDRLGVGYDGIKSVTEDIVYCSISAYGENGPLSDQPGFDPVVQARSGLMSTTGTEEGSPVRIGVAIVDLATGIWSTAAILNALRHRDRTGEGAYLEMSMFDVGISMLTKHAARYFITGEEATRMGTADTWAHPYRAYSTADDELVMIAAHREQFWQRLCELLDVEELLDDDRFETRDQRVENRDAIDQILQERFQARPLTEWVDLLEGEIPVGPVRSVGEAVTSEQSAARQTTTEVTHPTFGAIDVLNLPLATAEDRHKFENAPPESGEHAIEVLRELGYPPDRIQMLVEDRVI